MKPLKVMHVLLNLSTGGMEKFVVDLIPRFDNRKIVSTVCCIENDGELAETLRKAGIKITLMRKKDMGQIRFYDELRKLFLKEGVDIVHSYSGVYRDAVISAKMAKIPVNVHTDQGGLYPNTKRSRINHWFFSHFRDRVIAVSDELRNFLIKEIRLSSKKTVTIFNGVDVDDHKRGIDEAEKKRRLGLGPDEKVVGIIARLVPVKDHKTLFEAFSAARKAHPAAKLLVVGSGPLEEELKKMACALGEEKNIIFLGTRDDVRELLHIMDIVCLSSRHEGLSLTLAEAMATGKAVIATDVGGNPELVRDGITGFLVPPQNPVKMAKALIELLNNDGKRISMGEAGRSRIEDGFDIKKIARQYEDLYLELAKQKRII